MYCAYTLNRFCSHFVFVFESALYIGSNIDDRLVAGKWLNFFSSLFWQKVNVLLYPSKHSSWWRRLEDVLKTSFVFVFRRRLEDVLVKINIFVLAIRLQDVLPRCLQDVFKTFWKRLQDIFKTFSRRIIKLKCS